MHTIEFNFHTVTNTQAVDALVYALSIELFLRNRIECAQPCYNQLQFESAAHCMFAQLVLSNSCSYTVRVL